MAPLPIPDHVPISDLAHAIALHAVDFAAHYLAQGGLLGTALAIGSHGDLVPLPFAVGSPDADRPDCRLFPVLSATGPDPLRAYVEERIEGVDAYALLWDGILRDQATGRGQDALMIEVAVRGEPCGHLVTAAYRPRRWFRKFRYDGAFGILKTVPSVFPDAPWTGTP